MLAKRGGMSGNGFSRLIVTPSRVRCGCWRHLGTTCPTHVSLTSVWAETTKDTVVVEITPVINYLSLSSAPWPAQTQCGLLAVRNRVFVQWLTTNKENFEKGSPVFIDEGVTRTSWQERVSWHQQCEKMKLSSLAEHINSLKDHRWTSRVTSKWTPYDNKRRQGRRAKWTITWVTWSGRGQHKTG